MSRYEDDQVLTRYYLSQLGSGSEIYSGQLYQKGYGVGNWLSGLYRFVVPLMRRAGVAVGRELANTSKNVMDDMDNNVSFKTALKTRGTEAAQNLKRKAIAKMRGEGYKKARLSSSRQLSFRPLVVRPSRGATRTIKRKPVARKASKKRSTSKKRTTTKRNKSPEFNFF